MKLLGGSLEPLLEPLGAASLWEHDVCLSPGLCEIMSCALGLFSRARSVDLLRCHNRCRAVKGETTMPLSGHCEINRILKKDNNST